MGKKLINSRRGTYDGIKFASQLEIHCYKLLQDAGIDFKYEGEVFELSPESHLNNVLFTRKGMGAFKNNGDSKVRKMIYTPDFTSDLFIIEAKGRMSHSFPLRWKLFLSLMNKNNDDRAIYMPSSIADCKIVVQDILKRFY